MGASVFCAVFVLSRDSAWTHVVQWGLKALAAWHGELEDANGKSVMMHSNSCVYTLDPS